MNLQTRLTPDGEEAKAALDVLRAWAAQADPAEVARLEAQVSA